MSKVFFSVGLSLDGYMAPEGMATGDLDIPFQEQSWASQWGELMSWIFEQQFFREHLRIGTGGETGRDNQMLEDMFRRTGTSIMGRRMFDGGERFWPDEAPFRTPVFVLTHHAREPWVRPGGTTFHFVTDGIESALRQARDAAGDRDIRIAGGPDVIQQYLRAGLVDEFTLSVAPMIFGGGRRLFEGIGGSLKLDLVEAVNSPNVTHLRYVVRRGAVRSAADTTP